MCTQGMTDGLYSQPPCSLSAPKLSVSMIVPALQIYPHQSLLQDKLRFWGRDSGALEGVVSWMGGQLVVGVGR